MTDEKTIEEMAKDFTKFEITTKQGISVFAERLYNLGYRKIPENAVVLTKEELENMVNMANVQIKCITDIAINARKETAMEILDDIKFLVEERNGADIEDLSIDGTILEEVLDELAKQYGVEVE